MISVFKKAFSHSIKPTQTKLLINGKLVNSLSGKTFETINPSTGQVICSVQEAGVEDTHLAIAAARKAFDEGPWRKESASTRCKVLLAIADKIENHRDELAMLETLDNGKPLFFSHFDVQFAIDAFRYYAGWTDKIHGQTIPISGPYLCYTREEPVGVCGQIVPWNFPLLMAAFKIAPALACGNTTILKPAELTPLTALRLGELIHEVGIPDGVLNVVSGYGDVAGDALVRSRDVDKIAFTGSTNVGKQILMNGGIKRVTLELGGKNPHIVMQDADLDLAVGLTHFSAFLNSGQVCMAGSRTFVHEAIYDAFVEKAVAAAKAKKTGDPFEQGIENGPQISQKQTDKIMGYIESGVKEGARLLTGGKRMDRPGYFIEPTVFADVTDDMLIAKEEIFGPVMNIIKFKTIDEVIRRANATQYGLVSGVVTKDLDTAIKVSNGVQAGLVFVNTWMAQNSATPFGGYKNSGFGRELGEISLKNYLETKTVIIKRPGLSLP
ncbi:hypothetical protein FGO68_gene4912 [Halteria grandinella]|uniref:Aldehyde dehydrogenase domain-containing protein n=1 Tax=Halteria grandinella TaxID=5974 RepID=A0A8J8T216_HALGN|nr:hypothetical protein FGO68_gene4912 [Halteria grandinella]